jgi:hypothetical protein
MNPAKFLYPTRGFLNTVAAPRRIPACLTRNACAYLDDGVVAPASVRAPGRLGAPEFFSKSKAPELPFSGACDSESLPALTTERKLCVYFATR